VFYCKSFVELNAIFCTLLNEKSGKHTCGAYALVKMHECCLKITFRKELTKLLHGMSKHISKFKSNALTKLAAADAIDERVAATGHEDQPLSYSVHYHVTQDRVGVWHRSLNVVIARKTSGSRHLR